MNYKGKAHKVGEHIDTDAIIPARFLVTTDPKELGSHCMEGMDPAWIGMKLRKLLDYPEPLGDFMAFVPGTRRQQNYPSTVAYLAQLIIHRYAMLGVLDEKGFPTREMGMLEVPRDENEPKLMQGALCTECGNHTVIRKDGCDFCTACGAVGTCG